MQRSLALIPLFMLFITLPGRAAERLTYTIISDGSKKAGEMIVNLGDDGWTRTSYHYKNNGRGPDLLEEFKLAADGSFQEYRVKGTSTFGSLVEEHFVRQGSTAQWKSKADSGELQVKGPVFYAPNSGTFAPVSAWITALARSKNGLPLIPAGILRQTKLDEFTVQAGARKERVQLLALEGRGLSPNFVWATTGGKPRLFANIYPGQFRLIPEAWASAIPELEKRQKDAERKFLSQLAVQQGESLTELSVIRNARIFDSEKAELTPPSDVYFKKGRITAVLPAGSVAQEPAVQIDATGQVLLPGLFDMHAHINPWDGRLHLAAGVTTVRDLGNSNGTLQQMMLDVESRTILAPRIIPAGFLEGESPYSARLGFQIKTLKEAQAAIDWYAQNGYPQLKIYNSFPKEILRETVAYAHSRGLRVSGHVPAFLKASEVVAMGFDELQHINQLMLNFFVKPDTDTRTLDRFYLVAEQAADLDLDSKAVQDFIELLKARKTVIDPTLTAFDFIRHRDGAIPEPYRAVFDHLPTDVQRNFRQADMKIPDDQVAQRYEKSFQKMLDFVARMYKAGIPIVAGTDSIAGFTLQSELELYVKAGLTPAQVLQIATRNGAIYSRAEDRGVIASGKLADLVLIDGDPTRDIGELRKVSLVITQERVIRPELLYRGMGIKPFGARAPQIVRPAPAAKISQQ